MHHKWYAALAYVRANKLNYNVVQGPQDRFGIMASGKASNDMRQALVDLGLPDGDGTRLIRPLAEQFPTCTIVVTTLFGDDAHVFPALRAGAHGYLLKDQPEERLAAALEGILRGEPALSPAIAQRLLRAFQAPPAQEAPELEILTPREREVLVLVSKGCRLPELSERLQISRHTVSDHLKSIYRKLDINSRAEATLEAARLGLVKL